VEDPTLIAADGSDDHLVSCHLRTGAYQHLDTTAGAKNH